MNRIDARGKSCPQPVIMTKARVEAGDEVIEVVL
ncbi:MAG TPA: sulfurtransferase-like selenium metabolism protein YedF, partial [Synergistaceae bacterium]|nr:sulfurtransferase-like selenium metabolism protein YedF [Synergistaceae bacterium]